MNLADTLRGLLRRWYVVVPGLILAVALAFGTWYAVKPGYERTATQLLLPGAESMPQNANPFLFLGGLSNAADVLVRAVGAENVLGEVAAQYPLADVKVTRDATTAGPVILITVTGSNDEEAAAVLAKMVERTTTVLRSIQEGEGISSVNRITVVPVTIDTTSKLQQRTRIIATAGVGLGAVVLVIFGASLLDGLSLGRRRHGLGGDQGDHEDDSLGGDDPLAVDEDVDAHDPTAGDSTVAASEQSCGTANDEPEPAIAEEDSPLESAGKLDDTREIRIPESRTWR